MSVRDDKQRGLNDQSLQIVRRRARIIQLMDAAERAGITPLRTSRLHGFAYLADVLSPVWGLLPFDGKILKVEGGPHYPELQNELDYLVAMGLIEIAKLRFVERKGGGARIDAEYALRFDSAHLSRILSALGASHDSEPLDANDRVVQSFLVDLAGSLSTVPDDEIEIAATVDATYSDQRIDLSNIIDFGDWTSNTRAANLSLRVTERFETFLPKGANLSPGERLYLYASYLSRRIHAG